jgi:Holliday junction resolvase RusA-like endonuclease
VTELVLVVLEGPPTPRREPEAHTVKGPDGKARARLHPSAETVRRMELWREAWRRQSGLRVDGPVALDLLVECKRPAYHLTKSGLLTSHGRRFPIPPSVDVSNVVKLVEDALKGHAFGDDSLIGELRGRKVYTERDQTTVAITPLHERDLWMFTRPGARR